MKCEDFLRLSSGDPMAATAAERAGCRDHYHECKTCRDKFEASAKEAMDALTPPEILLVELLGHITGMSTVMSDAQDPEVADAYRRCGRR